MALLYLLESFSGIVDFGTVGATFVPRCVKLAFIGATASHRYHTWDSGQGTCYGHSVYYILKYLSRWTFLWAVFMKRVLDLKQFLLNSLFRF